MATSAVAPDIPDIPDIPDVPDVPDIPDGAIQDRFALMLHERIVRLEVENASLARELRELRASAAARARTGRALPIVALGLRDCAYVNDGGALVWAVDEPVDAARVFARDQAPAPLSAAHWDAPVLGRSA